MARATIHWLTVTATRDKEPWTGLLDTGHADERLIHETFYAARPARLVPIPDSLSTDTRQALQRVGIEALYEHQAVALEASHSQATMVTTGTASGKSLCFQLPTLEALTQDPAP